MNKPWKWMKLKWPRPIPNQCIYVYGFFGRTLAILVHWVGGCSGCTEPCQRIAMREPKGNNPTSTDLGGSSSYSDGSVVSYGNKAYSEDWWGGGFPVSSACPGVSRSWEWKEILNENFFMGVSPELLSVRETHNHSKGKCVFIHTLKLQHAML